MRAENGIFVHFTWKDQMKIRGRHVAVDQENLLSSKAETQRQKQLRVYCVPLYIRKAMLREFISEYDVDQKATSVTGFPGKSYKFNSRKHTVRVMYDDQYSSMNGCGKKPYRSHVDEP